MIKERKGRKPTTIEAVIAMSAVIVGILFSISTALVLETALVLGCIIATVFGIYLGYSWDEIQDGMIAGIKNGLGAALILICIGLVVGTWILGGTIQTMIYYGLNILTPGIFLPAAFLLSGITSLLIGSSFGTLATMGIVLMGVSEGLGMPRELAAGAVLAGAIFGDKISPMSDSTNLTSAVSGTDLFKHIKSMLYVSGPAALISVILYAILGNRYIAGGATVDTETVQAILSTLQSNFNITALTLVPPIVVLVLSIMKKPAVPTLIASFVLASITAVLIQGVGIEQIIRVAGKGYSADTGLAILDRLLSQGGVASMMGTVGYIMIGTAMGGILERIGVLNTLLESMMKVIKTPKDLIIATLISGYVVLIATGEMMVSIILPGRTIGPAYDDLKVDRSVLSRTLESSATLGCGILPWGVVSVYARNVLGVGMGYIPYAFLGFIAPIFVIIFVLTNFATFPADEVEIAKNKAKLQANN